MQVFEDLHTQNTVFRSLNATFLVLSQRKLGLVTCRISGLSVLWVDFIRLLQKS